jgi:hypothetical protein
MKLSECTIGKVVQLKKFTYDELMDGRTYGFGHVVEFKYMTGNLAVVVDTPWDGLQYYLPEDLKPLED